MHGFADCRDRIKSLASTDLRAGVDVDDYWRDFSDRLRDLEHGERTNRRATGGPYPFTSGWSKLRWSALSEREDDYEDWCQQTALLTLSGRTTVEPGSSRTLEYVLHAQEVLSTREPVAKALEDALDVRYEAVDVVGSYQSGHIHRHVGIFLGDEVSREAFAPVLDEHVANCELAGEDYYSVESDAITFGDDVSGLVSELGNNVPGMSFRSFDEKGHGVIGQDECPCHRVGACILDELGAKPIRFRL
jgi:hypothetical protein